MPAPEARPAEFAVACHQLRPASREL